MRYRLRTFLLLLALPCAVAAHPLDVARGALFALPADGKGSAVVALPLPDGTLSEFTLVDSRTLPRDLLRRFPAMRSFRGQDASGRTARLDYAPGVARLSLGGPGGRSLATFPLAMAEAIAPARSPAPPLLRTRAPAAPTLMPAAHGNLRYEFRIAVAAGSHFVAANGGDRASALGAVAHLLNRANDVLENDLGVHLTLAARNDRLMVTDHEGDPLRMGEPRAAAAELVMRRLPAASYDMGHALLGLEGGESATGTSCSDAVDADHLTTHKAAAWSGGNDADASLTHLLLVLGNQLGAPFRESRCGNCQAFDGASIARIRTWLASRGGRCARKHVVEAAAPWIDPESFAEPIVVPARTPFWLDATVEPAMPGRRLTYAWDDIDASPFFPSLAPTAATRREFTAPPATASRWHRFRLTVRDNGGETATVASEDAQVQVVDTGRAFALQVVPDAAAGQPLAIRWDSAGTTQPPLSCHFLEAMLSRDDGASWQVIARDIRNTGGATVPLPSDAHADHARLRLACDWRPFFAEAPHPFRIH